MRTVKVCVLVVGAGGCGLSAANFLADLGVDALTIERHPATSHLPKAHYINQRSMEIYRHHGLADSIYAQGAPAENRGKIHFMTSLGGDGPFDRKRFASPDVLGAGDGKAMYDLKGVTDATNIPQIRLEPILTRIVEGKNPGGLLFQHELMSFSQDHEGVSAIVRDLQRAEDIQVRCDYLIAADAGKTVGPALGIKMVGPTGLSTSFTAHFAADLSDYIDDDTACMRVFIHPSTFGQPPNNRSGSLLTFGPKNWNRYSEEWAMTWGDRGVHATVPDNAAIVERITQILKVDVPIDLIRVSRWEVGAIVANKFQDGRIFIAGDAAHKHSPTAGLGLNSGIQDAHNLCWKIAAVANGKASPALLATYETERRPVVEHNAEWSLFTYTHRNVLTSSLGLSLAATREQNEEQFAKLIQNDPMGETRRARALEVFKTARVEYAAHDMEMGFNYPKGAIVDDGSPTPLRDPMGHNYTPTTRPGCRLPHAWLNKNGERLSTHDLLPLGGFLLLTGTGGWDWIEAGQRLSAELGLPISAYRVGEGGDVADPSRAWALAREVEDEGAVLVRPDGHVAFRAVRKVADCAQLLQSVFRSVLQGSEFEQATG
jgi:2,4-dichlorophenol 6-monooxygenase